MKKNFLSLVFMTVLMIGSSFNAYATSFSFSDFDEGGEFSATVSFDNTVASVLTITIDNTSPTSLIDGTLWANAPAITGIGFNLDPEDAEIDTWTGFAKNSDGDIVSFASYWGYSYDAGTGNMIFDFYGDTTNGSKGGLYNPALLPQLFNPALTLGGPPQFFTTATITLNFTGDIDLSVSSPFVRSQNVGLDGKGSLKTTSIPDPSAMLLLGSACLIGFVGTRRKRGS